MATTKTVFKEYEYGLYGFICSYSGDYWRGGVCHTRIRKDNKREQNSYKERLLELEDTMKKLNGVVFVYGDYKDVI
jgi:hypothetical protein